MNDISKPIEQRSPWRGEDEIDLIELFRLLWRRKWAIAAITLLGAAIALVYALTATEKWTSMAYVRAPKVEQFKGYLEQRRAFARITGGGVVDVSAFASKLFNAFIELGVAEGVRQDFIQGSAYYKKLAQGMDAASAGRMLRRIAVNDLTVKAPGKNDIFPGYTLSFTANRATDARQLLTNYIDAVNKQVLELIDKEFDDRLQASVLTRQAELADLESKQRSERDNHIADLRAALATAHSAGLKDYAGGQSITGNTVIELRNVNRLFMLGEKYLSAELRTAQESPLIFPPRYYEVKRELQLLAPILKHQPEPAYSYSYRLPPTLPFNRDSPKRGLIVVLGLLLGGLLGCVWVLISEALRKSTMSLPLQPALLERMA